jgi:type I restriction enzyme S subunit
MLRLASLSKGPKEQKASAQSKDSGSATDGFTSLAGVVNSELPDGWQLRRLGELVERPQYGLTASATGERRGPRFLRITDIQESGVVWETVPYCECDAMKAERLRLWPGDVVLARIGATTGKAYLVRDEVDAVFASYLIRLRVKNELASDFLEFFTNSESYWRQIDSVKGGRLKQGVNIPLLKSLEIPLPPLPEQRAIADVLRTVQRAKDATEKVITAIRQLKASLMKHVFTYGPIRFDQADQVPLRSTDFGNMPAAWPANRLSDCAYVQTGLAKGRTLENSEIIELPYLRVANVQEGHLDLREMKTIQLRKGEVERFLLQPGDVVLTEGGDFDKLGRGFIWRGRVSPCVHQNHVFAVRTDHGKLLPEFLAYLAQSIYGKAYFLSVAHKTTNLACINTTKLKAFPVVLPSLHEQRGIAERLAAVDTKLAAEEKRRAGLAALFQSLLHHLMTGKVRLPDFAGSRA